MKNSFLALENKIDSFSVICVSGKMASGKNYVCSQLEKSGWISTDLDKTAHKAIELCKEEILLKLSPYAKKEGIELLNDDNSINRRNLGKLVFSKPELLFIQESIIYPKIIELTKNFISENSSKKIIINATVLFKTPELLNLCAAVVFVKAPFLKRLFRAKKRDGLPFRQILSRFSAQKTLLKEYQKSKIPVILWKNR